jgi:hypothetical protein
MNWERTEEIKRELFTYGEVPILVCSPEVREHLRAHILGCAPLRRMQSYKNLPYNKISSSVASFFFFNFVMTSDHLQGDLDKSGYRPATKFGYILATCLNNCIETWQFL